MATTKMKLNLCNTDQILFNLFLVCILLLYAFSLFYLGNCSPPNVSDSLSNKFRKDDVKILNSVSFLVSGEMCGLLGIKETDDPQKRKNAYDYVKTWIAKNKQQLVVRNEDYPVYKDGVRQIWLDKGHINNYDELNYCLVQRGLAIVDFTDVEQYVFKLGAKDGKYYEYNWKQVLIKAGSSAK